MKASEPKLRKEKSLVAIFELLDLNAFLILKTSTEMASYVRWKTTQQAPALPDSERIVPRLSLTGT
jgi:hypothetical protein